MLPYRIESLYQVTPWANVGIIAGCLGIALLHVPGPFLAADAPGASCVGMLANLFYHTHPISLIFNCFLLWVFGNTVAMNTDNIVYPLLFLLSGLAGNMLQWVVDGSMVLGAGAAVCGVIGLALVMYPINRSDVFLLTFKQNIFSSRIWIVVAFLAAVILLMVSLRNAGFASWTDIRGMITFPPLAGFAFVADLGGFLCGVVSGLCCLATGAIKSSVYDNRTLLDILRRKQKTSPVKDLTEGWQQYYRHMAFWQ